MVPVAVFGRVVSISFKLLACKEEVGIVRRVLEDSEE